MNRIPVVIPAYEPDERFVALIEELVKNGEYIIIVNDGSGDAYAPVFEEVTALMGNMGVVLTHDKNCGKGRALKTAFAYVLENIPQATGVVTADSDGQHAPGAIHRVADALSQSPDSLVLGVRDFTGEDIPWKSTFGNKLTIKVMRFVSGLNISDTQTGLRGIPAAFMRELLDVRGERFEFETEMLVATKDRYPIVEVPIETIYDSADNHQTHFNPVADSIRIYRVLGRCFIRFVFSSLSSSVIDLLMFSILCYIFGNEENLWYVTSATVIARVISATYNYIINYRLVFKSSSNVGKSLVKYACLAICITGLSAFFVTYGVRLLDFLPEVVIKAVVDTMLFFVSYKVQQKLVY